MPSKLACVTGFRNINCILINPICQQSVNEMRMASQSKPVGRKRCFQVMGLCSAQANSTSLILDCPSEATALLTQIKLFPSCFENPDISD